MARKRNAAKKTKVVACSQVKRLKRSKPVLYDDIFFTILSWVSAKCLHGIMRYVCNTWAQLIRNPHFVETHLQQSKPGLFVQKRKNPSKARFLEFKENGHLEITNFNTPFPGEILCSCEGMCVFRKPEGEVLYVANPIIMDVLEVPICLDLNKAFCYYGMARIPKNEGFKLVCGDFENKNGGLIYCYILTLGVDDTWRKIGSVSRRAVTNLTYPISIGQFIYWIPSLFHPTIPCEVVVTDTANECVSKFSFPEKHRVKGFVKIGNYLSRLQVTRTGFDIHVFKGVLGGNWTIYHKITCPPESLFAYVYRFIAYVGGVLIFIAFVRGLEHGTFNRLYFAYNMKKRCITHLEGYIHISDRHTEEDIVRLHKNSLVSWRSF